MNSMETILREVSDGIAEDRNGRLIVFVRAHKVIDLLKNWKRNRRPDALRVKEIVSSLARNEIVQPYISCAEIITGQLDVYDGMHRADAFKIALHECIISKDFMLIIDCLFGKSDSEIAKCFKNINKSVPVPDLYTEEIEDVGMYIISAINDLVKEYCDKYSDFVKVSKSPQRPNFNRDMFSDDLFKLYKDLQEDFPDITINIIKEGLSKLNAKYAKEEKVNKNNRRGMEKCIKYNFFLFIERNINRKHMKKILKEQNS